MALTEKQRAILEAMGVRNVDQVPTGWNKEQAELLRRIALAGGSCAVDECRGAALDALIAVGFVKEQRGDRVALTVAGMARARELRSPPQPRH